MWGPRFPEERLRRIIQGDALGNVSELQFRYPDHFCAGELHSHEGQWEEIAGTVPSPQQTQVLRWIRHKVKVEDSFSPFRSTFKGVSYHSAYPPSIELRKNPSCRPFVDFVCKTLLNRIYSGVVSSMASSQSSLPRNERQGKYITSKLNPRSVEE